MNFNKLLVNKTFLYVIFFLSITNVLGYLFMGDNQAIIHFLLIGTLVYYFNKNMAVVLLVALIGTNFLKVTTISVRNKKVEGMKNKKEDEDEEGGEEETEFSMEMIQEMKEMMESEGMGHMDDEEEKKPAKIEKITPALNEPRRRTKNSRMYEKEDYMTNAPTKKVKTEKFQNSKKKGGKNYVDHAATIESAYDNLDNILGKEGISNLTKETQHLLNQQKNLAKTMESMAPIVKNAKDMLAGFNLDSLKTFTDSNAIMK